MVVKVLREWLRLLYVTDCYGGEETTRMFFDAERNLGLEGQMQGRE